jgi:glycerol-3-phosphate dehydrogenase
MQESDLFDVLVVGGGVNGCGIARDAAGRGLSVLLVEEQDLAGATSSASTKLIHGGLRYLEQYEFRLVREALSERERLLASAPHIVRPLRFVLPHHAGIRPAWMVRSGLFIYDHLAHRNTLAGSQTIRLNQHAYGQPLKEQFTTGFVYSDCAVDDSRLVVLNAIDAAERGASIATRTRLASARRENGLWLATIEDRRTGERRPVRARLLVNAAGPWVADVLKDGLGIDTQKHVLMVKGSHIVTRRLFAGDQAYIFQNPDKRIVFAIPYERDFTLIGTTDVPYHGDPHGVSISEDETRYLCVSVSRWFKKDVTPADAIWNYSGVRPLYDDGAIKASVVSRDYVFDLDAPGDSAPVLSVFGGKITTFRRLAEHVMEVVARFFPNLRQAWTEKATLPGGDIPGADILAFIADLARRYPFLSKESTSRIAHAYGARAERFLGAAKTPGDLGRDLGVGLSDAEIDYLIDNEWATNAEDVLWRRSKLGLHLTQPSIESVEERFAAKKNLAVS